MNSKWARPLSSFLSLYFGFNGCSPKLVQADTVPHRLVPVGTRAACAFVSATYHVWCRGPETDLLHNLDTWRCLFCVGMGFLGFGRFGHWCRAAPISRTRLPSCPPCAMGQSRATARRRPLLGQGREVQKRKSPRRVVVSYHRDCNVRVGGGWIRGETDTYA